MLVQRIARRAEASLHRYRWIVLALFSIGFAAITLPRAHAKPLWHDEIYTVLLAGLPSWSATWDAAVDGADLSPPLNMWATRLVYDAGGSGHIATRIPPMIAFWASTALIFLMLQRRTGTTAALSGGLLPLWTAGYRYSYEARGYGLMMGLFAAALFTWSEAAAGRRRRLYVPLLALILAASLWNHYYGILTFVPIAAGELARAIQRRRLDTSITAALVAATVAAVPLRPLISAAASQREMFWSTARGADGVIEAYRFVMQPLLEPRFLITAGLLAALLLIAPFVLRRARETEPRRLSTYEAVAGLTALLIPALGVVLGVTITGVFVARYVLSFVVPLALAVPALVWRANVRGVPAELLLCSLLVYSFTESVVQTLYVSPLTFQNPVEGRPLLLTALRSGGPTVLSGSLQFLQLWYYTPTELKGRVRYLASPERAKRPGGSYTMDKNYQALARWTPVPVEAYDQYIAGVHDFRVYAFGSGWLVDVLRESGGELTEEGGELGARMYRVRFSP